MKYTYNIPVTTENLLIAANKYFSKRSNGSTIILSRICEQLVKDYPNIDMNDIDYYCKDTILNLDFVLEKHDAKMDCITILDMVLAVYLPTWRATMPSALKSKFLKCKTDLVKLRHITDKK